MKRTNSRVIKLPRLVKPGDELATGLDVEEIEELNARSYDYGIRTGIPTIEDYILGPFSNEFKERAFAEAVREVGLDSNGILQGSYSFVLTLDNKQLYSRVYPTTRTATEVVLSKTREFLDTIIADNIAGIVREGVRKVSEDAYVHVDYLLFDMERLKGDNSTTFNKRDFSVRDPTTEKELPLDKEIEEMRVFLDLERFRTINPKNADDFHNAQNLRSRIDSFLSDFQLYIMNRYGVSPEGLRESAAVDYELSDASAIRYLFSPHPSTEYAQIYSELVGRKTKSVAASNGDLDILKELAFKNPYVRIRGTAGIKVDTENEDKSGKGKTKIIRVFKDGHEDVRIYPVLNVDNRVYVRVGNILDTLEMLTRQYTSNLTQLKIDIFAAPPPYLR